MNTIKIVVPKIPPSMNNFLGNSHNYHNYAMEKKKWFRYILEAADMNSIPKKPYGRVNIYITYFFPNSIRRDRDNYNGKFLMDPLVKIHLLKDDDFRVIEKQVIKAALDRKNPRTEIVIEILADGD